MMADLATKDRYQFWQDRGLPIGPKHQIEGFRIGGWGGRSMEAGLKPAMYEYAEKMWKKLRPELRNNVMAEDIAKQAAHAVGAPATGEIGHGPVASAYRLSTLAPGLNFARIFKTVIDPVRTLNTYLQTAIGKGSRTLPKKYWRDIPSAEERRGASNRLRAGGQWVGTMLAALTVNDQFLRMRGSKQRVNFNDPSKND
jgi:hypothetical protein